MSAAYYTKALSTGVGAMCIWNGSNIGEILAFVTSVANETTASVVYRGGELIVWNEQIEIGDAIAASDDETPVKLPKIPKATLEADEWRVQAIQYDSNIEEVMDFVGRTYCEIKEGQFYARGMLVEDSDYVYAVPTARAGHSKKDSTTFEAEYTIES